MKHEDLSLRVKNYIQSEELIRPGETVVAGVSGGADSVCLLLLLQELSGELGFSLRAVHVHHGLRESAGEDQAFVEQLCGTRGIPCVSVREDAAASAAAWGTGVEEAGRRLRYQAFEEVCRSIEGAQGAPCRIAVAHHMEDQAETVLFHLCRGSGLRGARGMLPQNGRVIRPLLEATRGEIESWLTERKVPWRTDETNADPAYTRNYLRAEILPRLSEGVNPASAAHIAGFAAAAAEAERYLSVRTGEAAARCAAPVLPEETSRDMSGPVLSVSALLGEDPYMQGRVLYECLASCAGTRRDLGNVHIGAIRKLCEGGGNGSLSMPGGTTVRRSGDLLSFDRPGGPHPPSRAGGPAPAGFPLGQEEYTCRLLEYDGNPASIPRNQYTKWFDYDKIGTFPVFRTRRAGDRMTLLETSAPQGVIRKKLARVMLDGRVPAHMRDRIVLPFAGREALWVPGLRMGDAFRIGPDTGRILQICWEPGEEQQQNCLGGGQYGIQSRSDDR